MIKRQEEEGLLAFMCIIFVGLFLLVSFKLPLDKGNESKTTTAIESEQ